MKHPRIVEYLGTSHDPDTGLLVLLMELMDESLTHFLERSQQPLAFHIEVDLCHDIAQALVYIHSNDIIHRDLSGNNVLLLAGRAKITDFGMSKLLDSTRQRMTPLTMCPGTLAYMPPEALSEPPVYSKKIDCFSFGVLQIQIMTRQFPDPGPAMRVVEDSRSPTGTSKIPIIDSKRRKSHINIIDPTHTLLPTALSCLSYSEKDRPSAQDLCRQLAAFKEVPRYQLQILQRELQTKDQQLQDSQRHTRTLQQQLQTKDQQLQDSQRQIQQLTHQVDEKQHTIDDKETLLREINQQLHSDEQVTAEFQRNLLQHEQTNKQIQDTVGQLRSDLQQAVEEKQAAERRLREENQQLPIMPQIGAQPRETITPPRLELQQPQEKQHAAGNGQLQQIQRPGPLPQKTVVQQKAMKDMKWQKEPKAPQKISRGSAAVDANIAYFTGRGLTTVHSYNSDTQEWRRLPDTPHTQSTLVVVHHILTMVGGLISHRATNFLLSLMGEERDKKWLRHLPAMPTRRFNTAAVCSGCSLIVAGGYNDSYRLIAVEVLDTDTRQWFIASSLIRPFSSATISICGERLYMLGGVDPSGYRTRSVLSCSIPELLQSCQTQQRARRLRAVIQSTIWRHVADAPHCLSFCATFCGKLVAVGGDEACKSTSAISVYNETTDSWEAMGNMPTARWRALVAILNGKMMVVGGEVDWWEGTATDIVEILC